MDRYYSEIRELNKEHGIYLVKNKLTGDICVRKILDVYNKSIFDYIKSNPIEGMPQIIELSEENGFLTIIEEYIPGKTIKEILDSDGPFSEQDIVYHIKKLCLTLMALHSLSPSIIHRDIKPSNVIISEYNRTVLIDLDAAKITIPGQNRDTQLIGTEGFAAPEQYGFGASSVQTDIYGLGQLMHVMITNDLDIPVPTTSKLKPIIDKCLQLNPKDRYASVSELYAAFDNKKKRTIPYIAISVAIILMIIFLIMINKINQDSLYVNPTSSLPANTTKNEEANSNEVINERVMANDIKEEEINIHTPIGVYSGDYGEKLLLTKDNLAYYYCNSVLFTELACPFIVEDDSVSIELSKLHCKVTASVKSNDYSRLTFKSKSSNWNTEVFTKISDNWEEYYLSPPPSSSSVITVKENGEMQFYIADLEFTIPKNFLDYGDEYQSHDIKIFTDVDAAVHYTACSLFYEDNVSDNPNLPDNSKSIIYDFCCRFLDNTSVSSVDLTSIADKIAYCCNVSGTLNEEFADLEGIQTYGKAYVIYDNDSSEMIYILQVQKEDPVLDDSELFDYIINEAKTVN